jgi:hypothetical protein
VDGSDWLLAAHVLAAFTVVAAFVVLSVVLLVAWRRARPSEVALLLGLTRPMGWLFAGGGFAILLFGVALAVDEYSLQDGWILAALLLWLVVAVAGSRAGGSYASAAALAARLGGHEDEASPELVAAVRDRRALGLHALSGVALLAALLVMIFKPGA